MARFWQRFCRPRAWAVAVSDRCADDGNLQCSRLTRGFEATWRCAGRFPNPRRTVPLGRRARRSSLAAEIYPAGTRGHLGPSPRTPLNPCFANDPLPGDLRNQPPRCGVVNFTCRRHWDRPQRVCCAENESTDGVAGCIRCLLRPSNCQPPDLNTDGNMARPRTDPADDGSESVSLARP